MIRGRRETEGNPVEMVAKGRRVNLDAKVTRERRVTRGIAGKEVR